MLANKIYIFMRHLNAVLCLAASTYHCLKAFDLHVIFLIQTAQMYGKVMASKQI